VIAIYGQRNVAPENMKYLSYSRTIDTVLLLIIIFIFYYFYNKKKPESQTSLGYTFQLTYEFFSDKYILLESIVFTVVFFTLAYMLRFPRPRDVKPFFVWLIEEKIWIVFFCILIIMFFKYILNIDILHILLQNNFVLWLENMPSMSALSPGSSPSFWSTLKDDFNKDFVNNTKGSGPAAASVAATEPTASTPSGNSPVAPSTTCITGPSGENQVFNLGNNNLTYEEAQAVCKMFGADLANYDQVEAAYNAGGEWCQYGWSQGQMAFFPTQKSTWTGLQNNPATQNACGRPGINGGYIANPNVRFGANCYGQKPTQPNYWKPGKNEIPVSPATAPAPSTNPVDILKQQYLNTMMGFNNSNWTRY
jgi:hypothetical protein